MTSSDPLGAFVAHGAIDVIKGAVPLAPSYDTVGWLARDAALFAKVGAVLLGVNPTSEVPKRVLIAEDLFQTAGPAVTTALEDAVARVLDICGPAERVSVADGQLSALPKRSIQKGLRATINGAIVSLHGTASATRVCDARAGEKDKGRASGWLTSSVGGCSGNGHLASLPGSPLPAVSVLELNCRN